MPGFGFEPIDKNGYISELTMELNEAKDGANRIVFTRFTVTDDVNGQLNPVTFSMSRDSPYISDDPANPWHGLPYSSIQVAVLATVKDAYLQRKKISALGQRQRIPEAARDHVELTRITLSERVGPYLYQMEPGSVMDSQGNHLSLQGNANILEVRSEKEVELAGVSR